MDLPVPSTVSPDEVDEEKIYQLSEQELKTYAFTLEVFSEKIVSCLINRDISHRLYAVEYVKEHLENEHVSDEPEQAGDRAVLARAVFQVISTALSDTREKVVSIALALLDQVVRKSRRTWIELLTKIAPSSHGHTKQVLF